MRFICKIIDFIVIVVFFLVLGILLYLKTNKSELFAPLLATGIALGIGLRQYKTENDKIFLTLFTEFNKKYDNRFNDCLITIEKLSKDNVFYELNDSETKTIIDYLNFCAEEYLWYKMGRIPDDVWKSWKEGMVYYLNLDCINKIVLSEAGQKESYYGLFKEIGGRINNWI